MTTVNDSGWPHLWVNTIHMTSQGRHSIGAECRLANRLKAETQMRPRSIHVHSERSSRRLQSQNRARLCSTRRTKNGQSVSRSTYLIIQWTQPTSEVLNPWLVHEQQREYIDWGWLAMQAPAHHTHTQHTHVVLTTTVVSVTATLPDDPKTSLLAHTSQTCPFLPG